MGGCVLEGCAWTNLERSATYAADPADAPPAKEPATEDNALIAPEPEIVRNAREPANAKSGTPRNRLREQGS